MRALAERQHGHVCLRLPACELERVRQAQGTARDRVQQYGEVSDFRRRVAGEQDHHG